jgi:murein DD-endopeptidase MepM/ murein hydrolase activator NlpD
MVVGLCAAVTAGALARAGTYGPHSPEHAATAEWRAITISPIVDGSRTGARLPPGEEVERLATVPDRPIVNRRTAPELFERARVSHVRIDTTPVRFIGRLNTSVYDSLRAAGVPEAQAIEYLHAVASRPDVQSNVSPDDRFDLLLESQRLPAGEQQLGALLYAGIDRIGASDVQLLKWHGPSGVEWLDTSADRRTTSGFGQPVAGRLTSGFGMRLHPILGHVRFHRGVDFGAPWGAPVVAAADGRVAAAGWRGGYGRQVMIAHEAGLVTSYSHLSRLAAAPGSIVHRGQLIGYVGSSGLSTGPHLHFETFKDGRPVNPMSVHSIAAPSLSRGDIAAINARLRALLSIPPRRA